MTVQMKAVLLWPFQKTVHYCREAVVRYKRLNWLGKSVFWFLIVFHIVLFTALIVFTPARLAQALYDSAQELEHIPYGWLILVGIIVVASFPPLIGFDTTLNVCGFTYGFRRGYLIGAPSAVVAACLVFLVLRWAFKSRVQAWATTNERWQALEAVIREKGLPLIILIRISGFPPWVYSNAFFASVEGVSFWQFFVATLCTLPKACLPVFVGSQIAKFSDGHRRGEMDTNTKIINAVVIALTIVLILVTGALVHRWTQMEIRKLKRLPPEVDAAAVDALEEVDEGAPLLRDFESGRRYNST
ncbi:Golgi apparatus membrane protein TVP38 [Sistotremastrum niveocremeum HHB9708]|uniref:Golgi apparatus membrane protein TVP38 n=2 Tax=Sistotremastraceae TaxID=3402574 RepID=A0A164ZIT7_9AGAM|nr:Golgi apparatus membrane protein TVP38 [Sistotremastrum niveocremeum HHB9708]KZT42877.1 hypothetical protein SISSUDRAFT_1040734 [Sistotremastrum suecicum HHB10207 ss-3]